MSSSHLPSPTWRRAVSTQSSATPERFSGVSLTVYDLAVRTRSLHFKSLISVGLTLTQRRPCWTVRGAVP